MKLFSTVFMQIALVTLAAFCCLVLGGDEPVAAKGKPGGGGDPEYSITILPKLPDDGGFHSAEAISDLDVVVGHGSRRAVVWSNEGSGWSVTELPGLCDDIPSTYVEIAYDVNDTNQIVGRSYSCEILTSHMTPAQRAVIWQKESSVWSVTDLGGLVGGGPQTCANALNEAGQVVGEAELDDAGLGRTCAVLWEFDGADWNITTLDSPTDRGRARDINENGTRIVGEILVPGGDMHAALWQFDGTWTVHDLGVLDGEMSRACAINNNGEIAGYSHVRGGKAFHAVLWTVDADGEVADFRDIHDGGLSSSATDINDVPQVVGSAGGGFVWDEVTGMYQFPPLVKGHDGPAAYGINNNGKIVGWVYTKDIYPPPACLLTPIK